MNAPVLKYSVGIDIAKKDFVAKFGQKSLYENVLLKSKRKFSNTPSGFGRLDQWIKKLRKQPDVPLVIVMEATGVYHQKLAYFMYGQNYEVSIQLPSRARQYSASLGFKSKNDDIDTSSLMVMGAERQLGLWQPPKEHLIQLKGLTRQRESLKKLLTNIGNRKHAHDFTAQANGFVINQLEEQQKLLARQIEQLEQAIEQLIGSHTGLDQAIRRIAESIKGLGLISLGAIVAETYGFELFHSQSQLISYSGYDVVQNQSGDRIGKTRISKKGNAHIRRALHFPALNVVRLKVQPFAQLYDRVFERTKIKMKGYVAVQRKLLCIIYYLWKNQQAFDPTRQWEDKTLDQPS